MGGPRAQGRAQRGREASYAGCEASGHPVRAGEARWGKTTASDAITGAAALETAAAQALLGFVTVPGKHWESIGGIVSSHFDLRGRSTRSASASTWAAAAAGDDSNNSGETGGRGGRGGGGLALNNQLGH
jgi:hypothetical protein